MKEVIIATRNAGKAKEFVRLFSELGWTVRTLLDYDNIPDVEETGETFEENARIKAETVSSLLNAAVLADDSGLEIDALDGRPGVYSARYAGAEKNDEANIEKVLQELKNVPPEKRTARFRCVLAFAAPGEKTRFFSGTCEGKILTEKRGSNGFGYDPIFYVEEKGKTMAEMDPGEKNQISHRADAVRKLKDWLQNGYPEVREEK